jgi:hypothetical protein
MLSRTVLLSRTVFAAVLASWLFVPPARCGEGAVKIVDDGLHLSSPYLDVRVSLESPGFVSLVVDGLGEGKIGPNDLRPPAATRTAYRVAHGQAGGAVWIEYRRPGTAAAGPPGWRFELGDRDVRMISQWSTTGQPAPLLLNFDPQRSHVALLGLMNEDGSVRLPAVLHVPNQGSLRITSPARRAPPLGYDSHQGDLDEANFVKVTFPAATAADPRLEYRCQIAAIYPVVSEKGAGGRLAGFQRNWLNILQPNPRSRLLSNNVVSDPCVICLYEYADIARHAPPLAEGLTALDVVRDSLDRYLAGVSGFGIPGFRGLEGTQPPATRPAFLDSYPSMLIAAMDYIEASGDKTWARRHYGGWKGWAEQMLAMDRDGNGLLQYPCNGNSDPLRRPNENVSNWWDDIGFGHEDAYGNALAYRALRQTAAVCDSIGRGEDGARYRAAAAKLRQAYYRAYYNPATGILAGWRSADGKLHDYHFLWVNGAAIHYGLIDKDQANAIMDRLLAKMKAVGFTRFDLGLPGNLTPVAMKDYRELRARFGGGTKADGAEGFQHYENGGATACFAYFTLAALYDLGRREEADRILLPLLGAFDRNDFEGRDPATNRSKDWKSWDGAAFGYEGYLADNYYALLAVVERDRAARARAAAP